jgi:hypothetical protein
MLSCVYLIGNLELSHFSRSSLWRLAINQLIVFSVSPSVSSSTTINIVSTVTKGVSKVSHEWPIYSSFVSAGRSHVLNFPFPIDHILPSVILFGTKEGHRIACCILVLSIFTFPSFLMTGAISSTSHSLYPIISSPIFLFQETA